MSQHHMNLREGHLESLYLIFHFLWKNPMERQVVDPSHTMIDESVFQSNANWVEFYGDVSEEDLTQMPEALGEPVSTYTFFDSEHASNVFIRRSHTSIYIYIYYFLNGVINDFSKKIILSNQLLLDQNWWHHVVQDILLLN